MRRHEHKVVIPVLPDYQIVAGSGPIPPTPLEYIFITVNYPEGYEFSVEEALERAKPVVENVIYSPKWDDQPKSVGNDG